jgi:hypothetical protein
MGEGVYVIRNQLGQYWTRAGEWVDGREPQRVMRLKHRDEAVNQLVELSARDIDLRGEILNPELNDRGEPLLEPSSELTPTLAEKAAAAKAAEQAARAAAEDSDEAQADDGEGDASAEPDSTTVV